MKADAFESRLADLNADDEIAFDKLAAEFVRDVRDSIGVLRGAVHSRNTGSARRARMIIERHQEVSVRAAIAELNIPAEAPLEWMISTAGASVMSMEAAIVARLKHALTDVRLTAAPPTQPIEEFIAPLRVCDWAYVALRRMWNGESSLQSEMETRTYLCESDAWKDAEIHRYLATGQFNRSLQDVGDED